MIKKIGIVGLGLMGASYARKLKLLGYEVYGHDIDNNIIKKAIKDFVIDEELFLNESFLKMDLIILCLYPNDNISFIKKNINLFEKQLVTDISGVKVKMVNDIENIFNKNIRYVSHHPMVGRENGGYNNYDISMFDNGNLIVIESLLSKEKDINIIKNIAKSMGFKQTTVLDSKTHDEFIAYTSQLTHILATSLINAKDNEKIEKATGDSFRDLTRIAKINTKLWSSLFIDNKKMLIKEIDSFINEIKKIRAYIDNNEIEDLASSLDKGRERRIKLDEN